MTATHTRWHTSVQVASFASRMKNLGNSWIIEEKSLQRETGGGKQNKTKKPNNSDALNENCWQIITVSEVAGQAPLSNISIEKKWKMF